MLQLIEFMDIILGTIIRIALHDATEGLYSDINKLSRLAVNPPFFAGLSVQIPPFSPYAIDPQIDYCAAIN